MFLVFLCDDLLFSLFFQYYDLAADVLAENAHLTYKYLTPVSLNLNYCWGPNTL